MEGQVKCKHCHGKRHVTYYAVDRLDNNKRKRVTMFCEKCRGTGFVLWIDEIMGRNKKRRKRQWRKPRGGKHAVVPVRKVFPGW